MAAGEHGDSRNVILIDFAAPHPGYELSYAERIVHSGISVCRCALPPNPGQMAGATQLTITVHEDELLDMEWRLPSALDTERRTILRDMAHINPADHPIFQRWPDNPHAMAIALDRTYLEPIVGEAFVTDGVPLQPHIGLQDHELANIAQSWRRELQEGGRGGRFGRGPQSGV